jgi:hypothetical protein
MKARFKYKFVANTKFQGESRAHRKEITIGNRDKNHKSYFQQKVQNILGLLLVLTIYNLKC